MQIINEFAEINNKEILPQVLMRIFSVCKNDSNFPLKEQLNSIEEEIYSLEKKRKKQKEVMDQIVDLRINLNLRLQKLKNDNLELKTKLLEDLGSEI